MSLDFHRIREQIISRVSISELAKEYGLRLKGQGNCKTCACPWHSDKKPSLAFYEDQGTFRCFAAGCGQKGTAFDLVINFEKITFWDALCKLASRTGITIPTSPKAKKKWEDKKRKHEVYRQLISWTKDSLFNHTPALSYLTEQRGYNEELIKKLSETICLGYIPQNGLAEYLGQITSSSQANYIARTLHPLSGRIIAPWRDAYGEIIGWWGRAINGDEPKYLFSKGTKKTTPYLLHLAKRSIDKPVISLVEGLLDAALAQALGFSQIAALGGTAAPNKLQLQTLKKAGYKVVVLIPDADDNGHSAIVKAAERLTRNLFDLEMELLIAEIPEGTGKDIDEALSKSDSPIALMQSIQDNSLDLTAWLNKHYDQKAQSASTPLESSLVEIERKEAVQSPNFKASPLGILNGSENLITPEGGWIIPEAWHIDEKGVHRIAMNKDGEESLHRIAHIPFITSSRSVNIDTANEQLEVAFARDNILRRVWMERGELLNQRSIVSLANKGFPVTSRNAGFLVDYIADFEAKNIHHMPRLLTVNSFGWKKYDGDLFFVLGENAIGTGMKINFVPEGDGERNFASAMKAKGEYQEWLNIIRKAMKYKNIAFGVYASFAAPLLPVLEIPSFLIDYCGDSSIGKTTAVMTAASVWGDPVGERGGIVPTWNATSVSIERYAGLFKALPIFLDDSHLAPNQQVKSMVYMLAGGVGKMRGALKGSQATSGWRTVGFITGEKPVVASTTHEGARARVHEFSGSPFPGGTGDIVAEIKNGVSNHFGHAGPIYVDEVVRIVREESEKVRRLTQQRRKILSKIAESGIDNRKASYFSAVWTAASIAEKLFSFGGEPDKLIPSIFEESCLDGVDFAKKAMDKISSWVMANWNNFDTGKDQDKGGEIYGVIKVGEYVAIFPHKLGEYLTREGYSYEAATRSFRDRGWIQTEGRHIPVKIRYKGTRTRMIKILWDYVSM